MLQKKPTRSKNVLKVQKPRRQQTTFGDLWGYLAIFTIPETFIFIQLTDKIFQLIVSAMERRTRWFRRLFRVTSKVLLSCVSITGKRSDWYEETNFRKKINIDKACFSVFIDKWIHSTGMWSNYKEYKMFLLIGILHTLKK